MINKERELKKLIKEKEKEKKQVKNLERRRTEIKRINPNCCKDNENLICSIYENLVIVMDICSENISSFKNGICAFG